MKRGLFIFLLLLFGLYFEGTLKLFFLEFRPLSIDYKNALRIYKNECNYGKPSGHSFLSVLSFLIFVKFNNLNLNGNLQYYIYFITVFLILNSRLFLAAHSIDQIFMGLLISIVFFETFIYFKKYFYNYLICPILHIYNNIKFGLIICFVLFFLTNFILILSYLIAFNNEKNEIINKTFNNYCLNKYLLDNFSSFSSNHLFESLTINILFGLLWGIFLNKGKFHLSYFQGNDFKRSIIKLFLFILGFNFYFLKLIKVNTRFLFILKLFSMNFLTGFYIGFIYPKLVEVFNLHIQNKVEFLDQI